MKLGILGAMTCEISLLRDSMTLKETVTRHGLTYYCGQIDKTEVVLVECSIGKVNAAVCTTVLVEVFGCSHIINTGVAGGVSNDVTVFDVILSTATNYHDFYPADILQNNHPYTNTFPADQSMIDTMQEVYAAKEHNFRLMANRIVTGDIFVEDSALKASIVERFAPGCVDMESASVGHTCYMLGVPYIALRSLSDAADDNADMTFQQFAAIAANNSANLIIDFCKVYKA